MKRKLKKLSLVLGLILMASFTIGISKVSAAETRAIKFESRYVMETIKMAVAPRITNDDMVDLENLTLNLTQEQIDSIDYLWLGTSDAGFSINKAKQYLEDEKNIAKIDGVEYKKISLKGIENFSNISSVYFSNRAFTAVGTHFYDIDFHIQVDLNELEKNINIESITLDQGNFDYLNIEVIGKMPALKSFYLSHCKEGVSKSKVLDVSKIFPLTTKSGSVKISVFEATFSDEQKMWDYISSNQDTYFKLAIGRI